MILFFSIAVILAIAYAHHREGLFTAITMLVNVFLAGALTFAFFEPLAGALEPIFQGGILQGTEDFLMMTLLFCMFIALLRWATHSLSFSDFYLEPNLNRFGGALVGMLTGYLLAGFLVCMMETLPFHENFMGFEVRKADEGKLRTYLPPDRAWLAVMRYAGANALCWQVNPAHPDAESNADRYKTFDPNGTYEIRYARYRRYADTREAMPYQGEFEKELGR